MRTSFPSGVPTGGVTAKCVRSSGMLVLRFLLPQGGGNQALWLMSDPGDSFLRAAKSAVNSAFWADFQDKT